MKLTYRGINYQVQKQEIKLEAPDNAISLDKSLADAKKDTHQRNPLHYIVCNNKDKVISVRPIHYYTYRGVSYTKNLIFDNDNKLLLDIDRQ